MGYPTCTYSASCGAPLDRAPCGVFSEKPQSPAKFKAVAEAVILGIRTHSALCSFEQFDTIAASQF